MFKIGGTTSNGNVHARSMRHNHKCSICGRTYAMEWAKNNHEKLHKEYIKAH